jgi:hypothetical protein
MAFTEEQEKILIDLISKASQPAPAPIAEPIANKAPAQEEPKSKSIAQEAKDQIEADKSNAASLTQIQSSIKFNLSINDFVEKNKNLLPEETSKILSTAKDKFFNNDNERANTIRKNILDTFLEKQENIDSLTVHLANRAADYKSLAETDKEKRSSEFWDLVETGVALKSGIKKAEALNKINGGNAAGSSGNILEDRLLAAAKVKYKQ